MIAWLLGAWLAVCAHAQEEAPPEPAAELSEPSGSDSADSAPAESDPGGGEEAVQMIGGGEGDPLREVNAKDKTAVVGVAAASGDADERAEAASGIGAGDYYTADELANGPGADAVVSAPAPKPAKAPKGARAPKAAKAAKVAKASPAKPEAKKAAAPAPLAVPLTPVAPFNP